MQTEIESIQVKVTLTPYEVYMLKEKLKEKGMGPEDLAEEIRQLDNHVEGIYIDEEINIIKVELRYTDNINILKLIIKVIHKHINEYL